MTHGRTAPRRPSTLPPGDAANDAVRESGQHTKEVLIVNPAGLRERGGMGGMLRYLVANAGNIPGAPRLRVLDSRGTGSVFWSPFFLLRVAVTLIRLARRDRVRLLHVNMAERMSVVRKGFLVWLGRRLGVPVLLHLHAGLFITFYEGLPPRLQRGVRWVFEASDHVIVLGQIWKTYLVDRLGLDPAKISVVYNGVAAIPDRPPRRPQPGAPTRLIYVGRLTAEKGLAELLRVLARPDLVARDWTLTFVGSGEQARFEAMAETLGLGRRVRFTGWLGPEGVRAELAAADIFVLPSHYEGMPLCILEALSAGLPVISTAVGALPEVLSDGETALLVPPHDEDALAAALNRLMSVPTLRAQLGAAGAALHAQRFSVEPFARTLLALYDRVAPPPS